MRPSGSLDSFSIILSGLAKRLGLQTHLFEVRLQQQWREIIGEPVGSHTWPVQVRFKKLYLIVRNSVWLQQLMFLKPTPDVRTAAPASQRQQQPVNEAAVVEANAHAAAVQDPDLRNRLASLMAEAFSRPRS
jgi:hypothetical protein